MFPPDQNAVLLLTGATSGIGRATLLGLAKKIPSRLVIIGRDRARTEAQASELRAAGVKIDCLIGDLSKRAEVLRVGQEFLDRYDRLDVLLNNAGGVFTERRLTEDGLEHTFALNHMAYFMLTCLLVPRLKAAAPSVVVSVASAAHRNGKMHWDDLQLENNWGPGGWTAYAQSKLCNILFTRELSRKLAGTNVRAISMHPGFVASEFARNNGTIARLLMTLASPFARTVEQGADTLIWAATDPGTRDLSGVYVADRKVVRPRAWAEDDAAAARLWKISTQLSGLDCG